MNVFITGGTGFIGCRLSKKLVENGHFVTILTRKERIEGDFPEEVDFLAGDPTKRGPWQQELAGYDAIINLAGEPMFAVWNSAIKKEIVKSRILATKHIAEALEARQGKDTVLFNGSTTYFYGFHENQVLDEKTPKGDFFLSEVASSWETAALQAQEYGVRVVLCRLGVVLGQKGGALLELLKNAQKFSGGFLGTGRQWVSWIHEEDLSRIFVFLLKHEKIEGAINFSSPYPVRNKDLAAHLAGLMHKPVSALPIPEFLVKLSLGEFGEALLRGQRVVPMKLLRGGFSFLYPQIGAALDDLMIG